jgi:hypothetical protein
MTRYPLYRRLGRLQGWTGAKKYGRQTKYVSLYSTISSEKFFL